MNSNQGAPNSWMAKNVGAIVLAGGKNSRMGGADKAFLRVGDQFVVERTLDLLRGCFQEIVIVSNQPEKYAGYDVPVVADEFSGGGPLAGIHAGLGALHRPYAFVVACDMPFLRREPIEFLVSEVLDQDAVIPCWDNDIEPLHALYSCALRDQIGEALGRGIRAIREFLPDIRVDFVPEARLLEVPGVEEAFRNINTPEEAACFDIVLAQPAVAD